MKIALLDPLPAPHETISVGAKRMRWGYVVTYLADSPEALLAAGCVTPVIHAKAQDLKHTPTRDEDGDRFFRRRRPVKNMPDRVEFQRWITREAKALALPGVAEYLSARVPDGACAPRARAYWSRNSAEGRSNVIPFPRPNRRIASEEAYAEHVRRSAGCAEIHGEVNLGALVAALRAEGLRLVARKEPGSFAIVPAGLSD